LKEITQMIKLRQREMPKVSELSGVGARIQAKV
jgi:hypothetical protein